MPKISKSARTLAVGGMRLALMLLMVAGVQALAAKGEGRRPARTSADLHVPQPDTTGSISGGAGWGEGPADRSSALGNAEFPERVPAAQNFGNVTGGGAH